MGTFTKSFGSAGGYVAASQVSVIVFLRFIIVYVNYSWLVVVIV